MSKKILTFLGKYPKETKYEFNGEVFTGRVFAEAIYQFEVFDEMLVFVTQEARESSFPVLAELNDDRIKPIEIPIGATDEQMWAIFQIIVDQVQPHDTLVFDITHSLRTIPFFVFIVSAFLKSAKQVDIQAVYYGAYELQAENNGVAPIIDLSQFVSLLDWLYASEQFINSGNAATLATLIRQAKPAYTQADKGAAYRQSKPLSDAARALDDVSLALRLALPDRAMEASEALQAKLGTATSLLDKYAKPFTVLSDRVAKAYNSFALPNPRENALASLLRERHLIDWYLERNQIVQAVTIAREWVVSWFMLQTGHIDLYDREKRVGHDGALGVERVLGKVNKERRGGLPADYQFQNGSKLSDVPRLEEALNLYQNLGQVRNTLAHAGKQPTEKQADHLEKQVRRFCEDLKALPMPVLEGKSFVEAETLP